jgi:hypothetical protein
VAAAVENEEKNPTAEVVAIDAAAAVEKGLNTDAGTDLIAAQTKRGSPKSQSIEKAESERNGKLFSLKE